MKNPGHVIVVGGGIIGYSCALRLAHKGVQVTLIEGSQPASTDYAAGILFPNGSTRASGALGQMNFLASELWENWADLNRLEDDLLTRQGLVQVADNELSSVELANWRKLFAGKIEDVSAKDVADLVPGVNAALITDAVFLEGVRSINPVHAVDALRFQFTELYSGKVIKDDAQSLLVKDGKAVGVKLRNNWKGLDGDVVVSCTGIKTGWLPAGCRPNLKGQMGERLVVDLPEQLIQPILGTPGGSIVPRLGRHLWAGVTVRDEKNWKPTVAGGLHLLQNLTRWLPQTSAARIGDLGAGVRPISVDGLPFVGQTQTEGLYLATGHGRDGILQSPLAADMLMECITGFQFSPEASQFIGACSPITRTI